MKSFANFALRRVMKGEHFRLLRGTRYILFYAVKNYGIDFSELWGHNVDPTKDFEITIPIGKVEIYGMNCF